MRFRTLGRSGTLVSEFCLVTMTFGTETDEPEGHRILEEYVDAGGNFIDTANPYSDGASEQIIGSWLARRGRSDDLVIATRSSATTSVRSNGSFPKRTRGRSTR